MRTSLIPMRIHLRSALQQEKDVVGYNLAALKYISRKNEAERVTHFPEGYIDEEKAEERVAEGKKRKRVSLKA